MQSSTSTTTTMSAEMAVDFPLKRKHSIVRFAAADTEQLHIVDRHEDKDKLWYTKADYKRMKRNIKKDVDQARSSDSASKEEDGFWIGIAHLLTPACMLEVRSCRFKCMRAVLVEQARANQDPFRSDSWRCEDIALTSLATTRKSELRARMLGKMHQDCVSES